MFSVKQLYDLQLLDWDISAREKSFVEVKEKLADNSAVTSAQKGLEELDSRLTARLSERRKMETASQPLEEKLRTVEGRLYGGTVNSPRELAAFEAERDFLRERRRAEEDKLLEMMVDIEDLERAHEEARRQLERLEPEREDELVELRKSEERLIGEIGRMREARDGLTPNIPSSLLSVYESLRKTRGGFAVARIERGACQGCRLALTTMELQRARTSKGIVQCGSCRRILYSE